ncbi:hypothetical protein AC579_9286 [Pseudocercospora musae]|uniref:Velvet domain-containing protein n=1 Tax=Pseudocercospora musae TaxID=113226 RepID=A0A139HEH4_9PEZI|nr:hypothetical protein AC579_9286 [Pseudocercospora musae]
MLGEMEPLSGHPRHEYKFELIASDQFSLEDTGSMPVFQASVSRHNIHQSYTQDPPPKNHKSRSYEGASPQVDDG